MPITQNQIQAAEQQQSNAAIDSTPRVRLIAGPGTGKSKTIIKRIEYLLNFSVDPKNIYLISFTRATCGELRERIESTFANTTLLNKSKQINVSTMHSLALKILKKANLLIHYPSDPVLLDKWEQDNIYGKELANSINCTPTRANEIRLAHDAHWQTLNPSMMSQASISAKEKNGFNIFHSTRRNIYSCVLPGEVVFICVEAIKYGSIQPSQLPVIEHLIVDEFQDLNFCDQEFIRLISTYSKSLFVAGDDDQSIYSFRHADPSGIINFEQTYSSSKTHILTECFRCTPNVLLPALKMIEYNPNRVPKKLIPLYSNSSPIVNGKLMVFSFSNQQEEAASIASSCKELIDAGMKDHEDEIVILISNRRLQLDLITQELGNLGLPYEPPRGEMLIEYEEIRAVYSILRIVRENSRSAYDYVAYRNILQLLDGVGIQTSRNIADDCVANNQNFRLLFNSQAIPHWLTGRNKRIIKRISEIVTIISNWSMGDTLELRSNELKTILTTIIFTNNNSSSIKFWSEIEKHLPQEITLEELYDFLSSDSDLEQQTILDNVNKRLGLIQQSSNQVQKNIRILTMHGAKGLDGKVVFIPSCEQGIMPSDRALQAAGLVIEQRRLFYVSITRAKAACILSHSGLHTGSQAFLLRQKPTVRLTRSQFLNELGIPSVNRSSGLSSAEAKAIVEDINNL